MLLAQDRTNVSSVGADVQKRASRVLNSKSDAIIQSATGSGKTLSFVMPLLGSALRYPPEANPAEFPVRLCTRHSLSATAACMDLLARMLKLSRLSV